MRKIVASVAMIGVFVASLVVQAIAAETRAPVTKDTNAASPTRNAPATPARPQGVIINQLQAQPGYVFEAGPNNQVIARRVGSGPGGLGASASCGCTGTAGSCVLSVTGGFAVCSQDSDFSCNALCTFTTTQPSVSGGAIAR